MGLGRTGRHEPLGGVWSVDVELSEGLYCYKFIVDGAFIMDPSNPERIYCDGIENSLLRVRDHLRPTLTATLTETAVVVTYHPGSTGAGPDGTPSALNGAVWDAQSSSWTLALDGFEDGKHTLKVEVDDTEGHPAYDVLVPFWRGPHASFVWEDALVYMIMTDRFVNGNESNDESPTGAASGADWQGGDLAGVTQMIESGYFDDLGVSALWLTPFNTAADGTGKAADGVHDVSAFHGYWPTEARGVEPRLGTEDELHAMVDAAHERGIRVMMDFVVNHVHEDHEYVQSHPEWFNSGCICGQADCDWTEHRLDCQFTAYMPDVNWKNRYASEQFIADALWWMETFDLDGARIDAVKHVENLAVANLVAQINQRFETVGNDVYLKGETAMGWSGHSLEANQDQYGAINAYMGPDGLDGQADFVLYHAVVDNVFVSGNENYHHLDFWTNRSQDQYLSGSLMVPYVGSHDVPRLTSPPTPAPAMLTTSGWSRVCPVNRDASAYHAALQAYGWLLTTPGAPLLYYGDEYGEYGGADPDNRHMYRNESQWSGHEAALFENISELGKLRLSSLALRQGDYSTRLAQSQPPRLQHDPRGRGHDRGLESRRPTQAAVLRPTTPSIRNRCLGKRGAVHSRPLRVGGGTERYLPTTAPPTEPIRNPSPSLDARTRRRPTTIPKRPKTTEAAHPRPKPRRMHRCRCEGVRRNGDRGRRKLHVPSESKEGCTDADADNYDPEATDDDGSCVWNEPPDVRETPELDEEGTPSSNSTTESDEQNANVSQTTTYTCEGVAVNRLGASEAMCPTVDCGPCEDDAASASTSVEHLRTVLLGVVVMLILVLILTARRPPQSDVKSFPDPRTIRKTCRKSAGNRRSFSCR